MEFPPMIHDLQMGWDADSDRHGKWLVLTLHPPGNVFSEAPELADALWKAIQHEGANLVVLDMQHIGLLPSRPMGVLVRIHKRLAQNSGTLHLCRLTPHCHEALRACHLDRVLPVYADVESAVRDSRGIETII